MLLPALAKAKEKAHSAACVSNLKQWAVYWTIYADDNNSSFPTGNEDGPGRMAWADALIDQWGKKPYLLMCPSAGARRGSGSATVEIVKPLGTPEAQLVDYGGPRTSWRGANQPRDPATGERLVGSYGPNLWIYNRSANIQKRQGKHHWRKIEAPSRPSLTPIMADSNWRGGGPHYDNAEGWARPGSNGERNSADHEMQHFAMWRHGKGINVAFFDGSVQRQRPRALWSLHWHMNYDVNRVHSQGPTFFPAWMR
jgi:prepilin-type processing-associated H-X9-DG protein